MGNEGSGGKVSVGLYRGPKVRGERVQLRSGVGTLEGRRGWMAYDRFGKPLFSGITTKRVAIEILKRRGFKYDLM